MFCFLSFVFVCLFVFLRFRLFLYGCRGLCLVRPCFPCEKHFIVPSIVVNSRLLHSSKVMACAHPNVEASGKSRLNRSVPSVRSEKQFAIGGHIHRNIDNFFYRLPFRFRRFTAIEPRLSSKLAPPPYILLTVSSVKHICLVWSMLLLLLSLSSSGFLVRVDCE